MRAIDREAKRSERRRIEYEKSAQKIALLEEAVDAAHQYDHMIRLLTGAHRVAFQPLDWQSLAERPPAPEPEATQDHEEAARRTLTGYSPSWFARQFGFATRKRAKLERAVTHAIEQDRADHERLRAAVQEQNAETDFARRLTALEHDAVAKVVETRSGLGDLPFCVEALDLFFGADRQVIAQVDGLDLDDMPTRSVTLLQSGKASVKPLSPAKIQELHRANICASALRIAIELLQVVPVPMVEVVMETDLLDPATGHIEPKAILSVKVSRQAIASLALERTDALAVVERLGGEMDWNSRRGFAAIANNS